MKPLLTRAGGLPALTLTAVLCSLLALGGCQMRGNDRPLSSEAPPPPDFVPAPESCQAEAVRYALGGTINAPMLEELRMRAGAKWGRTAPAGAPPDAPDAGRLTVNVEPNGRIVAIRCG